MVKFRSINLNVPKLGCIKQTNKCVTNNFILQSQDNNINYCIIQPITFVQKNKCYDNFFNISSQIIIAIKTTNHIR